MLKLKLQYFGRLIQELTHWKSPWCWERLKARREGDERGWDAWMASPTQQTWDEQAPGVGDEQGRLACCSSWGHKELDTTEQLNWLVIVICYIICKPVPTFVLCTLLPVYVIVQNIYRLIRSRVWKDNKYYHYGVIEILKNTWGGTLQIITRSNLNWNTKRLYVLGLSRRWTFVI